MNEQERRPVEVGQIRRSARHTWTIYALDGNRAIVCREGQVDPGDWFVHNGYCCWEPVSTLEDCELLSPTPSPAAGSDRTRCKAFCGHSGLSDLYRLADEALSDGTAFAVGYGEPSDWGAKDPVYCSPACRDARVPPLPAAPLPATPDSGMACGQKIGSGEQFFQRCNDKPGHLGGCSFMGSRKPAPPAQEEPKAEYPGLAVEAPCDKCASTDDVEYFNLDNFTRLYCPPCRAAGEAWMAAQSGTPYTGPERLERPKLSHQCFDDSFAEDV